MKYDAVLFDAAETLFTTRGTVGEIYGTIARRFGSKASPETIHESFVRHFRQSGPLSLDAEKQWWKDIVFQVFTDVGMVDDFDSFFDEVYEAFRDSRGWKLFPETREVLETFRSHHLKLGVISNFDSRLYSVLDDLGIRSLFDAVTICSEVGFAKPHPRIFRAALHSLGVVAGRTLFTGDSLLDDFQAGQAIGLQTFLLDRSAQYGSASMEAVPRIKDLRELLSIAGIASKS